MTTLTENYNRFFNENLNEAQIPSNIRKFAKERGVLRDVQQIARWAEKAGERIVGGTAIGRGYDTLVLDLTYDGSEIYFDTDDGTIEVNGQPVDSWESFSDALNESVNEEYIELPSLDDPASKLIKAYQQWYKDTKSNWTDYKNDMAEDSVDEAAMNAQMEILAYLSNEMNKVIKDNKFKVNMDLR